MKIFIPILGMLCATQIVFADAPQYNSSNKNHCFKVREMMYPLEETFDALKQVLMQSNLNIVTVTKADGVLTAKGNQYNKNEDTILGITLTVDFKQRETLETTVRVIASYETIKKKSDTGQIGGGGITLPIPVPFTGRYTLVGQGNIDDTAWYRAFFNSLDKILFENHMKYASSKKAEEIAPVVTSIKEAIVQKEETQAIIEQPKVEEIKPVAEPIVEEVKPNIVEAVKTEELAPTVTNEVNIETSNPQN
jgi:hypothetical protein